jgi:hypothetical protein
MGKENTDPRLASMKSNFSANLDSSTVLSSAFTLKPLPAQLSGSAFSMHQQASFSSFFTSASTNTSQSSAILAAAPTAVSSSTSSRIDATPQSFAFVQSELSRPMPPPQLSARLAALARSSPMLFEGQPAQDDDVFPEPPVAPRRASQTKTSTNLMQDAEEAILKKLEIDPKYATLLLVGQTFRHNT